MRLASSTAQAGVTLAWLIALAGPAAAHDFWIQPAQFRADPGGATTLTLQVGHGPYRQRSPIAQRRILRFAAVLPNGRMLDLRSSLHLGAPASDGAPRLQAAGIHVLVLQTDNSAESHLPALRFNDYLSVEGLTPALQQRARTRRNDADGSESYSRVAKALIQVGSAPGAQAQVTRPLGLPLEIVPEQSPYARPRPQVLPVRVYYEGRPLSGALVKLTDLDHDEAPLETHLTDAQGRARFAMPEKGSWLLNVIWTKPLPASRATEFETVFSSLSFGMDGR